MEFDQVIFRKISNLFIKWRDKPSNEQINKTTFLESKKSQLTIMARALTGRPIDIVVAEKEGGWKNNKFFLAEKMDLFDTRDENEKLYWFRVFYLSSMVNVSCKLNLNEPTQSITLEGKLNKTVLGVLFAEFPDLRVVYAKFRQKLENTVEKCNQLPDYAMLLGKWMTQDLDKTESMDAVPQINKNGLSDITTEIKAKPVDEVDSISINKESQEEYMLTHNFEKVETVEEFNGNWRNFDGDDDLGDHADALDQVSMKHTVRVNDQTHSVYQSEFVSNASVPEMSSVDDSGSFVFYDEWDGSGNKYLQDHCKVFTQLQLNTDSFYLQQTIKQNELILRTLKKEFASYFNELGKVRKLNQGEEMDIDCITDLFCDVKAGVTPDDKIYNSTKKKYKDISILFLLDLSLSSDGYTCNRRIIDIEKQVSILIGEILNEYQINFQIDGFNSKTRNHCSYYTYKSFNDNWDKVKARVGAAKPEGYTRIGPALRHANSILKEVDSRSRWVVLLSDGKPNDYDKYEGKYGISDTRQAIRELKSNQVNIHTFAIEEKAKFYLPLIFGNKDFNVLSNPKELVQCISVFCRRLLSI